MFLTIMTHQFMFCTQEIWFTSLSRFQIFLQSLSQSDADCSLEKDYITSTRGQILSCHKLMLHQGQQNCTDSQHHNYSDTGLNPIHRILHHHLTLTSKDKIQR